MDKDIPATLDAAVQYIIEHTKPEDMEHVKSISERQFLWESYFLFGVFLRNGWELMKGSILAKHFNEMGIYRADDMSGIILTSFHRRVKGEDICLNEQVQHYKDFWNKEGIDPSKQS